VISGNGTFDTMAPRADYGDSFIKLSTAGGGLSVRRFLYAGESVLPGLERL